MRRSEQFDYAIIGTGYAGQCAAIRLQQSGRENFVLLEREASLGGVWRDNHYPGAECDVPSHLYSFSFEQNPDWSRKYPTQAELYDYIKNTAKKYNLTSRIRLNTNVENAAFDEARQVWRLQTSKGEITARFLLSGHGALAEPKIPAFPGLSSFRGESFHSARWNHDLDLTGKRVAVIGAAASAIQFVPHIVKEAAHVDVYQRTPNWIIPRENPEFSDAAKSLFRHVPPAQDLFRGLIYLEHEARVLGMVLNPGLIPLFERQALAHLKAQVKDPVLRQKLTPGYTMGCKRVLISNDWYPALGRPNCTLITEAIQRITPRGVRTADNMLREADVIIFATGFYVTDNPIGQHVFGREGQSLAQAWENGAEAYVGTTVHGFPNLFLLSGPNTGIGHTSMIYMIEGCVNHAVACIEGCERQGGGAIEVKKEVQASYNERLQKRLAGSVWATGCQSWYQDKNGKITTLWPGFTFEFRQHSDRFKKADYTVAAKVAAPLRRAAV